MAENAYLHSQLRKKPQLPPIQGSQDEHAKLTQQIEALKQKLMDVQNAKAILNDLITKRDGEYKGLCDEKRRLLIRIKELDVQLKDAFLQIDILNSSNKRDRSDSS